MKKDYDHDSIGSTRLHPESLMMGYGYEPAWSEGAAKSPIFQTSTFIFESAENGKAFFELAYGLREPLPDEEMGLIYSRLNNPDLEILEDRLTLWDDAETAAVFKSGMAAISTTLLTYLRPGDVLLYSRPVYGGTDHLINHVLVEFGIEHVGFSAGAPADEIEERLRAHGAEGRLRMILIETPANPTNALVDIEMVADIARRWSSPDRQVLLAVDNTFLGPIFQHPLHHGADLVIYSATKFIGGHSDLIAGACMGSDEVMEPIKGMRAIMGTNVGPWTGWLMMRSLETLKLRMEKQVENARRVIRENQGATERHAELILSLLAEHVERSLIDDGELAEEQAAVK